MRSETVLIEVRSRVWSWECSPNVEWRSKSSRIVKGREFGESSMWVTLGLGAYSETVK